MPWNLAKERSCSGKGGSTETDTAASAHAQESGSDDMVGRGQKDGGEKEGEERGATNTCRAHMVMLIGQTLTADHHSRETYGGV